jgi:hypothetical protein
MLGGDDRTTSPVKPLKRQQRLGVLQVESVETHGKPFDVGEHGIVADNVLRLYGINLN